MRLRLYAELLQVPHARRLVLGATISRFSAGLPLAIVLLVREASGSYTVAGAATAAFTLANAALAPWRGRLIDRISPARVVRPLAFLYSGALAALAAAGSAGVSDAALVALSGLAGSFQPSVVPSMRTMWGRLVPAARLQTAYAFEAVVTEVGFIGGPLLTGLLVALWSPAAAVWAGAALLLAGALLFTSSPAAREAGPPRESGDLLGALASPGIRVLVAIWIPIGAAVTALEVATPAFAEEHGSTSSAGLLLALLAAGSLVGGLWYGTRERPDSLPRRFALLCAALAVCLLLPVLAGSIPAYAVLVFFGGLAFAPTLTTASQIVDEVTPAGTTTEGFTWTLSAYMVGAALGAQTAGLLAESVSVRAAVAAAASFAALGALLALGGQRRLSPSRSLS